MFNFINRTGEVLGKLPSHFAKKPMTSKIIETQTSDGESSRPGRLETWIGEEYDPRASTGKCDDGKSINAFECNIQKNTQNTLGREKNKHVHFAIT